jgi:alkane 1-monooxygenase
MTLLPYLLVFVSPVSVVIAFALGGPWVLTPAIVLFVLTPLTDVLFGWNRANRDTPAGPVTEALLRALPLGFVGVWLGLLVAGLQSLVSAPWSPFERIALVGALGIGSAIAIAVAHELMHRTSPAERLAATIVMTATSYPHFVIEHVYGHHRNVGTPADPATARLGESLYTFLPRSVLGGVRSAWHIEAERLRATRCPVWSVRNRMLRFAGALTVVYVGVFAWLGPWGVVAFGAQGALAVGMLETINYIEHYGLIRRPTADGRWERVRPEHSWNASHRVTNWMIFNLARHSDHHAAPGRRFPDLRHHDGVPQMPLGYATMMIVALVPPLWFAIMDKRVATLHQA